MITVAIVEDNRLVREGLVEMLGTLPDVTVAFAAADLDSGTLVATRPSVVLLDIGLADGSCMALSELVQRELPDAHVIVMDLIPVHEDIAQFVRAGVAGFITKDATVEEFVASIRTVASGERVLPPRMVRTLFSQIASSAMKRSEAAALEAVRMTAREREVTALIAVGKSNREIALELGIATDTVKSHVRNIMEKLALHTRLQIAAYVHQREP